MKTVCELNMCNGCMACVEKCHRNAITIKDDLKYYNALVDTKKCVDCGLCTKVCPRENDNDMSKPKWWYQGWADSEIREHASSGGAASAIIRAFIKHGGYVASCLFDSGKFVFEVTNEMAVARKFAGSKYVKSNPEKIYGKIQSLLKANQKVLFIGLPCQVAAVNQFIKDKTNLVTADLICHGTPSPYLLKKCLQEYGHDINTLTDGLYQLFINTTYKQYQDGTQDGLYGYRAALADHYSQNGTYITIVLLTVWAVFLTLNGHEKKRKYIMIAGIATVIALLLTSKRAHLLFGVATLIVVYYVVNPEKRLLKSFKLMMAAVAALIGLNFLMDYVPDIARVFERFQTAGSDNASLLRILMWDRACSIFNQNPILGIGWYGFRYKSGLSTLTGATAGCHNIYLELLCETGLLGFCVFIMAMASSIVITWKNINYLSHQERDVELTSIKLALSVSFAIQFFVLLYGMTGNPIYDSTFCFYAVAVAINISFTSNMRGRI